MFIIFEYFYICSKNLSFYFEMNHHFQGVFNTDTKVGPGVFK